MTVRVKRGGGGRPAGLGEPVAVLRGVGDCQGCDEPAPRPMGERRIRVGSARRPSGGGRLSRPFLGDASSLFVEYSTVTIPEEETETEFTTIQDTAVIDDSPTCPAGEVWSERAQACVVSRDTRDEEPCPSGTVRDPRTRECVEKTPDEPSEADCAEGEIFSQGLRSCIPEPIIVGPFIFPVRDGDTTTAALPLEQVVANTAMADYIREHAPLKPGEIESDEDLAGYLSGAGTSSFLGGFYTLGKVPQYPVPTQTAWLLQIESPAEGRVRFALREAPKGTPLTQFAKLTGKLPEIVEDIAKNVFEELKRQACKTAQAKLSVFANDFADNRGFLSDDKAKEVAEITGLSLPEVDELTRDTTGQGAQVVGQAVINALCPTGNGGGGGTTEESFFERFKVPLLIGGGGLVAFLALR